MEVFWHLAKQRLNAKLKKQAREERERLEGKIIDEDDRQEKKPFNMYEDEWRKAVLTFSYNPESAVSSIEKG